MNIYPDLWLELIRNHKERYPLMTARDVYKLLFQSICGPEHLEIQESIFKLHLDEELSTLTPDPLQPLTEEIQPVEIIFPHAQHLFRVNLRRWLCTGQSREELVEACLSAARLGWGRKEELRWLWISYCQSIYDDKQRENDKFSIWLHNNGYPPVHHSEAYRRNYSPSYRLICL